MTPTVTRVIFFGSGDFAVPVLKCLVDAPTIQVSVVVTQPDQPAGRHRELRSTPVKELAQAHSLPLIEALPTPEQITGTDLGIVVDYGRIIPPRVFNSWPLGVLNIHPSLLPRYRGPAPIQRALLAGDEQIGVSIMRIERGVDTGPLLAQVTQTIDQQDTSVLLEKKLAERGAGLLLEILPHYIQGHIQSQPQASTGITHADRLKREDGALSSSDTALQIWNKYRALQPWPGVYFEVAGKRIKVVELSWSADNQLVTHLLQPAGKKPMTLTEFKRGYPAISFPHIL